MGTPISVHDKDHPSLGATEEEQDVSRLARVVVPPGAYFDPNNPDAAAGSVNLSLDKHPLDLSPDYGELVSDEFGTHVVESTADKQADGVQAAPGDRSEWKKADWHSQAEKYGLPVSGNTDAPKRRVEDYEAQVEDASDWYAGDWMDSVDAASNANELSDLRRLYDASGAEYTTVEQAFDERAAEFNK